MKTLLTFICLLFLFPLHAQEPHQEDGDHHHDSVIHLGPINVLGQDETSDILHTVPTVSNLHGDELFKKSESSLGETLRNEVGVNSSQFGPASSRPVIRGLEGDRIRILQNGIGVLDASGTSQDHAVPIHPLAAESVEIVRGPISLLYGSSAVGGVVNIVNSRIHKNYYAGFLGALDLKAESVNQGQTLSSKMDYGVKNMMFHFDGNYQKAGNTDTPAGEIMNSELEQHTLAVKTTAFSEDRNSLGISYSTFQNIYGVVSEPDVDIHLQQNRIDLAGFYHLNGFFDGVQVKSAQNFYEHREKEDGVDGTVFENSGNETRIELIQKNQGAWHGILGLQTQTFDWSAEGLEAYLPPTDQRSIALFAFEEIEYQPVKINFGLRAESIDLKTDGGTLLPTSYDKNFLVGSAALGGVYLFNERTSTTLNLSFNERAPNYQELFSNGAHLAVGVFEVGDPNLQKETSFATEWSIKRNSQRLWAALTFFNQEFQNYIALTPTGAFDDTDESGVAGDSVEDFPILNYQPTKARLNGIEFETKHRVHAFWSLGLKFDYLYGQDLDANVPLPRISPMRLGFDIFYEREAFESTLSWRNVFKQTRTAPQETSTPAYNLVDLDLAYKVNFSASDQVRFFAQVKNLTDERAQNHVSVIKDRVLLPGRNFVAGVRWFF